MAESLKEVGALRAMTMSFRSKLLDQVYKYLRSRHYFQLTCIQI
jgi:hypothetical protein